MRIYSAAISSFSSSSKDFANQALAFRNSPGLGDSLTPGRTPKRGRSESDEEEDELRLRASRAESSGDKSRKDDIGGLAALGWAK